MTDNCTNEYLFFLKVIEFLQQNWAYLIVDIDTKKTTVLFISDNRRFFNRKHFDHYKEAIYKLKRNRFDWYLDPEKEHKNFLTPPKGVVAEKN
jgi:hypothetical protein